MRILRCTVVAMAVAMAAPHSAAQERSANEEELYAAARTEGPLTWYVSQYTTEDADRICAMFRDRYPGVGCNPVRSTGQVVFQRIEQELQSGALQADVVSTNDDSQLLYLKQRGNLARYAPDNLRHAEPTIRDLGDSEGYWIASGVTPVVIGYNTGLVSPGEAPASWTDLHDPKWRDQIAMGHPGFSGVVGLWAVAMEDLYGWDFFERLEENRPHISRSILDAHNLVVSGERKISVAPLLVSLRDSIVKQAPIAVAIPSDGMVAPVSATAILDDAPNPNAARLFLEFILSVEVSEYHAQTFSYPLRQDVGLPEGAVPLDSVRLIIVPAAEGIERVPEAQAKFRDTFGI